MSYHVSTAFPLPGMTWTTDFRVLLKDSYYYPHLTVQETEARRREGVCSKLGRGQVQSCSWGHQPPSSSPCWIILSGDRILNLPPRWERLLMGQARCRARGSSEARKDRLQAGCAHRSPTPVSNKSSAEPSPSAVLIGVGCRLRGALGLPASHSCCLWGSQIWKHGPRGRHSCGRGSGFDKVPRKGTSTE